MVLTCVRFRYTSRFVDDLQCGFLYIWFDGCRQRVFLSFNILHTTLHRTCIFVTLRVDRDVDRFISRQLVPGLVFVKWCYVSIFPL